MTTNKSYYFNKNIYLTNLKKNFNNSNEILKNIRSNYSNYYVIFNGEYKTNYLDFLLSTNTLKSKYSELILLLLTPVSFAKGIEIIKKNLNPDYHIIFNKTSIKYNITCHCLAKQFHSEANINIFKLDQYSNIIEDFTCILSITLDFNNSEPVLFNLSDQIHLRT